MNIQFSLTVAEGKSLLAEGIVRLPEVKKALKNNKVLLKGGTTVSLISEIITNTKIRISGRITPRGTTAGFGTHTSPHSILIENGVVHHVDNILDDTVIKMGPDDLCIISANAIDAKGNAAMLAGAPLGGNPGRVISGIMAEGIPILIPAGLEKLIPGAIADAVKAAGRKKPNYAMGMAVGLIPITGTVFTELDAVKAISGLEAVVIARGGVCGAEGASVFAVEGPDELCLKLMKVIQAIKGSSISAAEGTLKECEPGSPGCSYHLACIYRGGHEL